MKINKKLIHRRYIDPLSDFGYKRLFGNKEIFGQGNSVGNG